MNDYVLDGICRAKTLDGRFSKEWFNAIGQFAAGLNTNGSAKLVSFHVRSDGQQEMDLIPRVKAIPKSLVKLARDAWGWSNESDEVQRGKEVIRLAREEFTRSYFYSLLLDVAVSAHVETRPSRRKSSIQKRLEELDWADADAVTRFGGEDEWNVDSRAANFREWCSCCKPRSFPNSSIPPSQVSKISPTEEELSAALALTWIDEAVASPTVALSLMAEAAQAMRDVGYSQGCDDLEPIDELTLESRVAKKMARRGADEAHRSNRAAKARVLAAYAAGNFASKDKAAEEFAGNLVTHSFRTVRGWLSGV